MYLIFVQIKHFCTLLQDKQYTAKGNHDAMIIMILNACCNFLTKFAEL